MKLQLGDPPNDADPYEYFVNALKFSGAGSGTVKIYSTAVRDFLSFIKKDPRMATNQDLINWINELSSRKGKLIDNRRGRISTVRIYVIAVRRFLRWLGVNVKPPIPRTKNPDRKALRDEDIEILLSNCRKLRDKVIISLLIDTGLRSSEILSIKVKDINLNRKLIKVIETKNGEERIVLFTTRTAVLLERYLKVYKKNPEDLLFDMSYQALYKLIRRLGEKTGIDWLRPHILRHTFATKAIKKGLPLPVVQRLLGHKDIKTTQIYTHLVTEDLEKAYKTAFES
ncbi:tyrosine-type recombinase/integrase [Metallosphaera tengchongensis]|uniref:Tyrosine recombinase XerA n=1 Tax=Metallosphaera tengchongensis TaxID=1532350 RepID=A0A6N0NRB9_9CREN|nr:site-specific tyrosine recombinase/integron integrase [Metallosphaera tengchongensis]QKQ99285.1 tyrosine-type recombinase/integrase [Metallosphaera tengchongensis]